MKLETAIYPSITVDEYIKRRNELLFNFEELSDLELLEDIIGLNLGIVPETPEIARIELHKMRLQVPSIPKELQERSKKWLIENGYSLSLYEVKK